MEVNLTTATSNDLDLLLILIEEFYQVENIPFDREVLTNCLGEIFHDDRLGMVWLISVDGKVIGYLVLTFGYSLEFQGRDALVDEFYIREGYRGQGIGTQSLKFVEKLGESLGIKAIHLVVAHKNHTAKRVYEKVGFIEHDRYIMTKWIKKE